MMNLNDAIKGQKFISRSGETVYFVKHHHINNHKVIKKENGEEYLVTQDGIALNSQNDIVGEA